MQTGAQITIAGGGISGLALALALKQARGDTLSVAVHDPAFARVNLNDARAYAIAAGTRRMFETLGVWDQIANGAQPILAMDITDSKLDEPVRPLFLSFEGEVKPGEPFAHMVQNGPMISALHKACTTAGVVLSPVAVASYTSSADGVDVTLADGTRSSTRLLVAADGARSKLREQAGISFYGWTYDQKAIVGTIEHERDHEGRAVEHFLPSGPFALLPLTGRRSSIVWTERAADVPRILARDTLTQAAMIEKRFGLTLGEITLTAPLQALPLSLGLARNFTSERFALLGDAAHVIHPIAGQGLNLGLKDAAALAEAIVDHLRLGLDPGDAEVLAAYSATRRFDTVQMAVTTDILNRLFSNDASPLRMLRNLGLGLVNRMPRVKEMFISQAAGIGGGVPRLMRGDAL